MVTTYLRRAYSSFAVHVLDVPPRLLSLLFLLLLISIPIMKPSGFLLSVLIYANIMAIFSASWDLLVGRAGQMSLGHALFFGIGAYGTALLYKYYGLPLWTTIPIGVLIGVLVSVPAGFPALRMKGPYLALVSLAFPLIATGLVFYFKEITGGETGIGPLPRFFPHLDIYHQNVAEYYLTLLLLFISTIILYKVANSKTGIVMVSILDDELASKACGINITKYKLMAFAISALFGSLAGALMAHSLVTRGFVGPATVLSLTLSFQPVIITILGGIGSISGPVAAAFIITVLDQYVLIAPPAGIVDVDPLLHPLIFITLVVIFIIKWPRGIARFVTDKLEDLAEEREIEERGPHIWKKYKKKKKSSHEG